MEHISFWGRYIDDVLIFWDRDKHLFQDFVHVLNTNQIGMHFTSEIQEREITFLDLKISIDLGGHIQTDIYIASQQLLTVFFNGKAPILQL